MGAAILLLLLSVNAYLLHNPDYAAMPNTFIMSSKVVGYGLIGVLPVMIGVSIVMTAFCSAESKFATAPRAMFASYFIMFGDTFFDTLNATHQI